MSGIKNLPTIVHRIEVTNEADLVPNWGYMNTNACGIFNRGSSVFHGKLYLQGGLQITDSIDGYVLVGDSFGNVSWKNPDLIGTYIWRLNTPHLYYLDGKVAIGTTATGSSDDFTVDGDTELTGALTLSNGTTAIIHHTAPIQFIANDTNTSLFLTTDGQVAIGAITALERLDVSGNIRLTGNLRKNNSTLTVPDITDVLVTRTNSETLSNKNLDTATLSSNIDFGGYKGVNSSFPTAVNDLATKGYVDSTLISTSVDFQESVLDIGITAPPAFSSGNRYIVSSITAIGDWAGYENHIVESGTTAWTFTPPDEGMFTWVENEDIQYVYNGSSWIRLSSTQNHSYLQNLLADDHTQYLFLNGRAGGQVVYGGNAASNNLVLHSTSHASKGVIQLKDSVLIGTNSITTSELLEVWGSGNAVFRSDVVVKSSKILANDGNGLYIRDDGDNKGIFIQDGGDVGINKTDPDVELDVGGDLNVDGTITAGFIQGTVANFNRMESLSLLDNWIVVQTGNTSANTNDAGWYNVYNSGSGIRYAGMGWDYGREELVVFSNLSTEPTAGDNSLRSNRGNLHANTLYIDKINKTVESTNGITVFDYLHLNERPIAKAGYGMRHSTSREITGTANVSIGSSVVTGTGTTFFNHVFEGDKIYIGGMEKTVVGITSNTLLSVDSVYSSAANTGISILPAPFSVVPAPSKAFVINSGGFMGLRKSNPQYILDIKSDTVSGWAGRLSMNSTNTVQLLFGNNSNGQLLRLDADSIPNTTGDGIFTVQRGSEKLFNISGDGSIGISTVSPSQNLHVFTSTAGEGARIGSIEIGNWKENANWASLAYTSNFGITTAYSLRTDSSGTLYLNTKSGGTIGFIRENDTSSVEIGTDTSGHGYIRSFGVGRVTIGTTSSLSTHTFVRVSNPTTITLPSTSLGDYTMSKKYYIHNDSSGVVNLIGTSFDTGITKLMMDPGEVVHVISDDDSGLWMIV